MHQNECIEKIKITSCALCLFNIVYYRCIKINILNKSIRLKKIYSDGNAYEAPMVMHRKPIYLLVPSFPIQRYPARPFPYHRRPRRSYRRASLRCKSSALFYVSSDTLTSPPLLPQCTTSLLPCDFPSVSWNLQRIAGGRQLLRDEFLHS